MAVGSLRCVVINVTDLSVAEAFWSEVTGLRVIGSNYTRRFSYLGQKDPWKHEIILQLVREPKGEEANQCHVDLTIDDIDRAIEQIVAIGGRVKERAEYLSSPGVVPRTSSRYRLGGDDGSIRNEFCLVSELSDEEISAVEAATDATTDQAWRAAAGRTRAPE